MKQLAIQLAKEAAWAPLAVVIFHGILGKLFSHEPYVDPVSHFLGGAAIAYFIRRAAEVTPRLVGTPSEIGLSLLALGLACFAAIAWELGELGSDIFLGTNIQRSASNTTRDLGLGLGGAFVYLVIRFFFNRSMAKAGTSSPMPT